jgi:hypothetical protein
MIKPMTTRIVKESKKTDMQEEDIIRKKDSGRTPFKTPDGYFENFTERLMARLPESTPAKPDPKVFKMNILRRVVRYAAAAVVTGICIGAGVYLYNRPVAMPSEQAVVQKEVVAKSSDNTYSDDYLDEAMQYEMLDNTEIAYYLTEAY